MNVHVSAALICRDGRLLAARRAAGEQEGLWELPGGKVRVGERADEALRREIAEELGVEVGAAWLYDTVEHDYPEFHLTGPSPWRTRGSTPSCAGSAATSCSTSSGSPPTSR